MSWIDCKVRKPTAEDADKNGCVLVQTGNGSRAVMKICAMNNNDVAWMPIDAFVPLPLPEPPAGYRILADRSLPWHPATKHWVSRISEWQTSGGHHKREYIGDDIYAVPIEPPEPQYRPFASAEEFRPFRERWWRPKGGKVEHPPIRFGAIHHGYRTWQQSFDELEFDDGTPFGVKVEETV